MKPEAARPFDVCLVVAKISLVRVAVGARLAVVMSCDVAERSKALVVAVLLAHPNLSVIGGAQDRLGRRVRKLVVGRVAPATLAHGIRIV